MIKFGVSQNHRLGLHEQNNTKFMSGSVLKEIFMFVPFIWEYHFKQNWKDREERNLINSLLVLGSGISSSIKGCNGFKKLFLYGLSIFAFLQESRKKWNFCSPFLRDNKGMGMAGVIDGAGSNWEVRRRRRWWLKMEQFGNWISGALSVESWKKGGWWG